MAQAVADRSFITDRWLEYEGELRAGLLRVVLISCFYAVELFNYLTAGQLDEATQQFHRQATYLSAAWVLVSLAALVAIARQVLPAWLKYATSGLDVLLLTSMAWFGSGASSPLVCLYLLLVVMAGLRGSLKLIWFTTLLSLGAYLALPFLPVRVVQAAALPVKPIVVMVVALGIAAAGLVTGQLVRMLRQIVSEVCLSNPEIRADEPARVVGEVPA